MLSSRVTRTLVVVALLALGAALISERDRAGSVKDVAREHRSLEHRLPIAIVKEKIGEGEGGEIANGPDQALVDQRAYPRAYVDDARAAAGRQAYLDAPAGGPGGARKELRPVTPALPRGKHHTGAPATNTRRGPPEAPG